MKLYCYCLMTPLVNPPYIRMDECEVAEKSKTYQFIGSDKPNDFYRQQINKEEIGKLIGKTLDPMLFLEERNDEQAMAVFLKSVEEKIEYLKKQMEKLEDRKRVIIEYCGRNELEQDELDRD